MQLQSMFSKQAHLQNAVVLGERDRERQRQLGGALGRRKPCPLGGFGGTVFIFHPDQSNSHGRTPSAMGVGLVGVGCEHGAPNPPVGVALVGAGPGAI